VTRIEVFADIVCPFTHVGLRRLSEARRSRETSPSVRVRAWPLEWLNGAPLDPAVVVREIDALRAQVAPDLFAGSMRRRSGEVLSLALRDALFERGRDVSDDDVLRTIGQPFGIEPLAHIAAESAIRTDWERGKARDVKGSPHFFVGDRGWFCPTLDISHEGQRFDVRVADETMRDFYAAAFS